MKPLLFAALILSAASVLQANPVKNSSFDAGTSDWQTSGLPGIDPDEKANRVLFLPKIEKGFSVAQELSFKAASITFRVKATQASTAAPVVLRLKSGDGSSVEKSITESEKWIDLSFTAKSVQLLTIEGVKGQGSLYLDDVVVK